jgi:hypothetical protein
MDASDFSAAEKDFARALSLAVRDRPVAYRDARRLAAELLGQDARPSNAELPPRRPAGGVAMDAAAAPGELLSDVEKCLERLDGFLRKNVSDDLEREKGSQLARALMTASATAGRQGLRLGADRRMAHDARSTLDRVLGGFRPPSTSLTGR